MNASTRAVVCAVRLRRVACVARRRIACSALQQRPLRLPSLVCRPLHSSRGHGVVAAQASSNAAGASTTPGVGAASFVLRTSVVLSLGVSNRVLQKLALVPLNDFVLALSLLLSLAYLVVYGVVLFARVRSGVVTPAMLRTPKTPFLTMGALETAGQVMGLFAAARLPGPLLPVLAQSFMLWQFLFSATLLRRRYAAPQLFGVALVAAGVAVVASPSPSSTAAAATAAASVLPAAALYVFSTLFPALDNILKEKVFADAATRLGGGESLDLFVVNTGASAAQALFTLALFPLLCALRGVPLSGMPAYAASAWSALSAAAPVVSAYIAANLAMNVALLRVLRASGAVVSSLIMSVTIPLTALAFTLPLPLLGAAPRLTSSFWVGVLILLSGLVLFAAAGTRDTPAAA